MLENFAASKAAWKDAKTFAGWETEMGRAA